MSQDYVERARALLGTRFRAQGREPGLGLDCAGLAIAAYGLNAAAFRRDYRLRGDHRGELEATLRRLFRRVSRRRCRPGDLLVMQVAKDQLHLAVATEHGFIHADARLGKIVETPGAPEWPRIAVFRRRVRRMRNG